MAKENLTIEDLAGMEELTVLSANSDRIILEPSPDGHSDQFIIIRPKSFFFEVAYLKEVKTKS